jgi:large subunit ribosomal protein L3
MNTILGTKINMSQTYVDGVRTPVTYVDVSNCVVTQIKTDEKDGYFAIQLGIGEKKLKNTTKPMKGHLKSVIKEGAKMAPRFLKEVKMDKAPEVKPGDVINAGDIFKTGDKLSVTGISKGKGFAGGVKRWHFRGGSKTHGQSDRWRAPGSIGQGTTPGRVYKGKHMAGRMGTEQIKVKGLKVINVDTEKNIIEINGPVPGIKGTLLFLTKYA